MMKRINGFSAPYSQDQILVVVIYLITSLAFYFYLFAFIQYDYLERTITFVIIYTILFITVVYNWYYAEKIDPEYCPNDCPLGVNCIKAKPRSNRYCSFCQKTVLEFDHHCTFLNTCIGSKNFVPFVNVIGFGTLQMIVQVLYCLLLEFQWVTIKDIEKIFSSKYPNSFYVLINFEVFLCICQGLFYGAMTIVQFYIYVILRSGTFDLILDKRNKRFKNVISSALDDSSEHQSQSQSQLSIDTEAARRQEQRELFENQMIERRKQRDLESSGVLASSGIGSNKNYSHLDSSQDPSFAVPTQNTLFSLLSDSNSIHKIYPLTDTSSIPSVQYESKNDFSMT